MPTNMLFIGDNGEITCPRCAGHSIRETGRDVSGAQVSIVRARDLAGHGLDALTCEAGCTEVSA